MNYIQPRSLKKGDTIGLIAPSSPLKPERLGPGVRYLEQLGYKVKLGKHLQDAERFLAGKDQDRAQDIMDFFKDPEVSAIMATCGGYGSQRVLPFLDYAIIAKNPKMLLGFSDTTALQLGLLKMTGLITHTGFTFRDAQTGQLEPLIEKTLLPTLQGEPYQITEGTIVHSGVVEGPLVGGNLSLINLLVGTPYQPNFKNSIFFFEELWMEPYMVDAMLSHLELAGIFDEVAGIIIGQFEDCIAKQDPERDGTIEDVIQTWSSRFRVPCLKDFPYGHGARRAILPIGKNVQLDVNNKTVRIS